MPNPKLQEPQYTPNPKAAASLAFATQISQSLMPKQPQSPQNAPGQSLEAKEPQDTTEEPKTPPKANLEAKMSELENTVKTEISGIKDVLLKMLQEDKQEDKTETK